jgi:hypothetical protein
MIIVPITYIIIGFHISKNSISKLTASSLSEYVALAFASSVPSLKGPMLLMLLFLFLDQRATHSKSGVQLFDRQLELGKEPLHLDIPLKYLASHYVFCYLA